MNTLASEFTYILPFFAIHLSMGTVPHSRALVFAYVEKMHALARTPVHAHTLTHMRSQA